MLRIDAPRTRWLRKGLDQVIGPHHPPVDRQRGELAERSENHRRARQAVGSGGAARKCKRGFALVPSFVPSRATPAVVIWLRITRIFLSFYWRAGYKFAKLSAVISWRRLCRGRARAQNGIGGATGLQLAESTAV